MSLGDDLSAAIAAEARLAILKALAEQADGRLSDVILVKMLDIYGYRRGRDWTQTQIRKLAELDAVSLQEVGSVLFARIERAGRDHLEERSVLAAVARPHEVE